MLTHAPALMSSVFETEAAWAPGTTFEMLRHRAGMLRTVRDFFLEAGVLEVETPLLSKSAVPDLHIHPFVTRFQPGDHPFYLHTSPETFMKRMLAAGSGPIYQIAKVFRNGEQGRLHNPEFTLIEWYRPGWDYHALMQEVSDLVQRLIGGDAARKISYREAFLKHASLDPFTATHADLRTVAHHYAGELPDALDRDDLLDLLLSNCIMPNLTSPDHPQPVFLIDYPVSQAAMAQTAPGPPPAALRFELFLRGMEIANGYQ